MKLSVRRMSGKILSAVVALQLFVTSAVPVSAGLFSQPKMPNPSSFFSDAEKRYNIDTETIQEQGQSLNVAGNKKPVPEASIFFTPADPKPGEKISARAFPMYFTNEQNALYYTWYLKRVDCALSNSPSAAALAAGCDRNTDSKITVEDWKVEAMSIIAQNGFDKADIKQPVVDDDNDGYKAQFGGNNKTDVPNHCYVNDAVSGKNYELLSDDAEESTYDCAAGTSPVCLEGELLVNPLSQTGSTSSSSTDDGSGHSSGSGSSSLTPSFEFVPGSVCHIAGLPYCSTSGVPTCSVGAPRCLADPTTATTCGTALTTCTAAQAGGNTVCRHLFPNAPGGTTGDGTFGAAEEAFWGTNPNDPDTSGAGNKDEANLTGLGKSTFTWNYIAGDQVGVVIEGTSMITTKYNDSSSMIMWAFSKKDCPISVGTGVGEMTKKIKGYNVTIPTVKLDLNKCLERNLVDPVQGGQATNLEVEVAATPDNPLNDESADDAGDIVSAQATIANQSRTTGDTQYDWKVEMSDNIQFRDTGGGIMRDVTSDLQNMGLLGNAKGIALDTLRLRLDIPRNKAIGNTTFASFLDGDVGYLRFKVTVSESFASGITRKGKSDVVVKFVSSGKRISAFKVNPVPYVANPEIMHVTLSETQICNDDALDRSVCRVVKNEVIGMQIDATDLTDFKWTINGVPLNCTQATVSPDCGVNNPDPTKVPPDPKAPNNVNFFPVSGEVGDTYTVTVTANDLSTGKSDKTVTLTRAFHVVEPVLSIASIDENTAWAKLLGQYKEVSGKACPGGSCPEYSETVFEAFAGETLSFKGVFMPNFLAQTSTSAERQWTVDGATALESGSVTGGAIAFAALKNPSEVYNVTLQALVVQSQGIRQALRDIWSISPLDSPEIRFSTSIQVELKEPGFAQGTLQGSKKYLAAIASYVPASVMFLLRIILSVFLLLFTINILYALFPERAVFSREFFRRN